MGYGDEEEVELLVFVKSCVVIHLDTCEEIVMVWQKIVKECDA
jgi:hypothetical protein